MQYFFHNPETNASEGPYTVEMLQVLRKQGKLVPDSLLFPPNGKEWIPARNIKGLWGAPKKKNVRSVQAAKKKDDFVHPLSKKGILQERKNALLYKAISLFGCSALCLFLSIGFPIFMSYMFSPLETLADLSGKPVSKPNYWIYILPIIFCGIVSGGLGFYLLKKSKAIVLE